MAKKSGSDCLSRAYSYVQSRGGGGGVEKETITNAYQKQAYILSCEIYEFIFSCHEMFLEF